MPYHRQRRRLITLRYVWKFVPRSGGELIRNGSLERIGVLLQREEDQSIHSMKLPWEACGGDPDTGVLY